MAKFKYKLQNVLDIKYRIEDQARAVFRDNDRAIENIKGQIKEQEKNVEAARKGVEQARMQLTDAMQERKIHEKLKENSFVEFMHEVNAAESKEIDELVSYTYGERIKADNNNTEEKASI